ncbi:MAG: site-specific DNA-methyltransferase [Glaciimonas sp.]|nr:site-specific DNA-methyltransferase [Glaciimonas sp.]
MNPTSQPIPSKQRDRFINLLRELFQLNQPDLDFGLYRIMHAKSAEIEKFLTEDLLAVIAHTFGGNAQDSINSARASYETALATSKEYGAVDPENSPKVQQARTAYEAVRDSAGDDTEIYDHLYRFFERYYDQGDFLSRRYYARETHERAAPYSVPYDGSEVYLHWANKDQYYIKTSENFNNYSIDLSQAKDIDVQSLLFGGATEATSHKMHFKLVEAEEGEHNNVKAAADKDRFFVLDATPIAWQSGAETSAGNATSAAELVLRFQYRADPDKTGNTGTWRDKRNAQSVESILAALQAQAVGNGTHAKDAAATHQALAQQVGKGAKKPGSKQETQPLLARYLYQYTAKNTMDYFIHKDLGGFLKRELDFYIKNEVMRLDDLGTASAPHVANFEKYLKKLHTLRSIAQKLIEFLAQIEDFQKKLWLKKKFVIDTQWLVTLDKVPPAMYAEIAANATQWQEWGKLGFLMKPAQDLPTAAKSGTLEYLQANTALVLDTQFFDAEFTARLLASIDNLDDATDGVLVHSENFQALNLMQARYREQVKCIYIDPPYNTASTPILYKNEYKHSSWASLIQDRLILSKKLASSDGLHTIAIDDAEMVNLSQIVESVFYDSRLSKVTVVHNPKGSITKDFNRVHEYALFVTPNAISNGITRTLEKNDSPRKMRRWGENSLRVNRRPSFYPIYVANGKVVRVGIVPSDEFHPTGKNVHLDSGEIEIWPIDQDGIERRWNFGLDSIGGNLERVVVQKVDDNFDLFVTHELTVPKTVWSGGEFDAGKYGNTLLIDIIGKKKFDFPKSINLVKRCVYLTTAENENCIVLDYFGGSGTTGHAVIQLNRERNLKRRYVLVEMGTHFDEVLKPRITKIVHASMWKDATPVTQDGISQLVKVIRLESYEDTLNNLQLADDSARQQATAAHPQLREDYYLHYLLSLETEGSPSLLNVAAFADPTAYQLDVKRPGSDAHELRTVDLVETFNWLIGLRVDKLHAPQTFSASFMNEPDPDLPTGSATRLLVKDKLKQVANNTDDGAPRWWFRSVEGRVPGAAGSLIEQSVLVLWRKLSGNLEQDNAVLEAYLREVLRLDLSSSVDKNQFDVIYVNGSHTLPKLPYCDICLLEQTFHERMWESQDV